MLPTEIELLIAAYENARKNLGRFDRDIPALDDTQQDALDEIGDSLDQLKELFADDPYSGSFAELDEALPDALAPANVVVDENEAFVCPF